MGEESGRWEKGWEGWVLTYSIDGVGLRWIGIL